MVGGDISQASHYYGIIVASYSLMQFLFAPILGALSDHYGRRPVLLIALFGSFIDYLLLGWAQVLWLFVIARMLSGLSGATISVGMAYITDISTPEKRSQNFGLVGAAFGLGFTIGPALGGILGYYNLRWPFFLAALLTLANFIYGYFILPESLQSENRNPISWKKINPIHSFGIFKRTPFILGLTVVAFLASLAQTSLETIYVLYTKYRFNWTEMDNGVSLAFVGIMAIIVQGFLIRKLMPKWGERKAVLFGIPIALISFLLYGSATQGWMIYCIIPFGALAGLANPALQGILSQQISDREQGALQGAIASLGTLTRFISQIIATQLFGFFTHENAPIIIPGIAFYWGAFLWTIALILIIILFKHEKSAQLEV